MSIWDRDDLFQTPQESKQYLMQLMILNIYIAQKEDLDINVMCENGD